jgi:hypothetical protein
MSQHISFWHCGEQNDGTGGFEIWSHGRYNQSHPKERQLGRDRATNDELLPVSKGTI